MDSKKRPFKENATLKKVLAALSIMVLILLAVNIIVLRKNKILEYEYSDGASPGTTYKIRLIYDSRELYVYKYNGCSEVNCGPASERTSENTIILTPEEIEKVRLITKRPSYNSGLLASALSSLALNDKIMAGKADGDWGLFIGEKDDSNNDVITYREFGNSFLDSIINTDG